MNLTNINSCYGFQASDPIYDKGKVVNAIVLMYLSIPLSILAAVGNGLILYAILTTKALQKAPNVLLAFIAITDFLAGILAIPMNTAIRTLEAKSTLTPGIVRLAYRSIVVPLTSLSFLTIGSLSIDRLLACSFPLKYRTWELTQTYRWIFAFSWCLSIFLMALGMSKIIEPDTSRRCLSVILFAAVVSIILSNWRIYGIVRAKNVSAQNMLSRAAVEQRRKKQKRLLKTLAMVTLFFLVCHLPNAIVLQISLNEDSTAFYYALRYSSILTFLNSSLNPIIVCYRKDNIRRVVSETLSIVISKVRRRGKVMSAGPRGGGQGSQ